MIQDKDVTMTIEYMKRLLGWCPSVNSRMYRQDRSDDYAYPPLNPKGKRIDVQPMRSGNVIFPADTTMSTLILAIGFSLISYISRYLDYRALLAISITMYVLCYFIVVKSYRSSIRIDENGVHYNSFRLRNFTLNYKDIKSIRPVTWERNKYLKNTGIFLAIVILIMALSIIFKGWIIFILLVPSLPVIFLLEREEKRRYHDLDTQVYIESRKNKWWYELSPYYSVITDRATADLICAKIEQYTGDKIHESDT